jgi:hypothetical protein
VFARISACLRRRRFDELFARVALAQHRLGQLHTDVDLAGQAVATLLTALEEWTTRVEQLGTVGRLSVAELTSVIDAVTRAISLHKTTAKQFAAGLARARERGTKWTNRVAVATQIQSGYLVAAASKRVAEWAQIEASLVEQRDQNQARRERFATLRTRLVALRTT